MKPIKMVPHEYLSVFAETIIMKQARSSNELVKTSWGKSGPQRAARADQDVRSRPSPTPGPGSSPPWWRHHDHISHAAAETAGSLRFHPLPALFRLAAAWTLLWNILREKVGISRRCLINYDSIMSIHLTVLPRRLTAALRTQYGHPTDTLYGCPTDSLWSPYGHITAALRNKARFCSARVKFWSYCGSEVARQTHSGTLN